METTETNKDAIQNESLSENGSSAEPKSEQVRWDPEKFPSYQKNLPKRFWGDERLKGFSSLEEMVESVVNPKRKAPEKYGLKLEGDYVEKLEGAFRKADVSNEDAVEIAGIVSKAIPKRYTEEDLKEHFGDDYEGAKSLVDKALDAVCGKNAKLKDSIMKSSFANDPAFYEFARIVGNNVSGTPNLNLREQKVGSTRHKDPFMRTIMREKEN